MAQIVPYSLLSTASSWVEFLDWQFYLLFYPVLFLYGIAIGSFLNVVILRLPKNESLIKRSSHCMTCGAPIRKRDLIPVLSWLMLRGKCHSCGEKISCRYPVVESLNGLLYLLCFAANGFSAKAFLDCLLCSLLIVVGFMDWDTLEIDLRVLAGILILAVPSALLTDTCTLKERVLGAVCVSLPFYIIGEISGAVMKRRTGEFIRGIELGDTLLMVCAGALIGVKAVVVAALVGILLAAVCGVVYKHVTGESKFAFGPFLSIGILVGTLWGETLANWYIGLLTPPSVMLVTLCR